MSERDPSWSDASVFSVTRSAAWLNPEAALTFSPNNRLVIAENQGSVLRDPVGALRDAYVTVTLTAGNLYHFFASNSVFTTSAPALSIFDSDGYRLLSIDGDDLFPGFDGPNSDSILLFAPEATGTYYINVAYSTFPLASGFFLEAWEDIGGDGVNQNGPAPTTVTLSPATQTRAEGDSGTTRFTYTVTRSGDLSLAQSVAWAVEGSGANPTNGADFTGGISPSGVVDFAAGQATATITIDVQGDQEIEQTETFALRISALNLGVRVGEGVATGVIQSDETPYALSAAWEQIDEGPIGRGALITVTRSGDLSANWNGSWTVSAATSGDSADAADFPGGVFPSGRITLRAGQASGFFTFTTADDTVIEPNERFTISLWAGEATAGERVDQITLTIADNDSPPPPPPPPDPRRVLIETTSLTATEGTGTGGTYTFTLRAEGITTEGFIGSWRVMAATEGSSVSASDFASGTLPHGLVEFTPGQTTRTVTLTFAGDAVLEADEQFVITATPLLGTFNVNVTTSTVVAILRDDDGNRVSIVPATPTLLEGTWSGATAIFRVTRTQADSVQTVDWVASGLGTDDLGPFTPSGRLVFAVGEFSQTIAITMNGDMVVENDETLTVSLSAPLGGVEFATREASMLIRDDDASLSASSVASVTEGQAGATDVTITLTRAGSIGEAASVPWYVAPDTSRGAGVDGADFVNRLLPSGTATFAPGAATTTVTLQIAGDTRSEPDEYFTVYFGLSQPVMTFVTTSLPIAILNDDPRIDAGTYSRSVSEGSGGVTTMVIPLVRSGPATDTDTVTWAVSRSVPGAPAVVQARDFVGGVLPSGSVTFAAGETVKDVIFSIVGDSIVEAPEAFFRLVLATDTPGLGLGTGITGSIRDDDVAYAIQTAAVQAAEGNAGSTPFNFTVARTGAVSAASTVAWAVTGSGSSPADAADFAGGRLPSGALTFAAGETSKTITINVAGDRAAERTERFAVTLSTSAPNESLDNASALGIILADDSSVAISPYNAVKPEGHPGGTTPFLFTVTRTGVIDGAQSVAWSVVSATGGGRANAADFVGGVLPSGIVEFAAGENRKTITVNVAGDASRENDETFTVRLASRSDGLQIGTADAQGTILRDETVMAIAATSADAVEGSTPYTFTVTRSGVLDAAQVVNWSVVNYGPNRISAADFEGSAIPRGSLRFEAGETAKTITINIASDTSAEKDETFAVKLLSASPGVTLAPYWVGATIRNDDTSVGITALSASKAEGNAGTTPFTFAITRTGLLDAEQSVSWAAGSLNPNRATGADFAGGVLPAGTVTFASGEAQKVITLDVLGDTAAEAAEGFIVRLSSPTNGLTISGSSATGLILNDDVAASRLAADWVL